jgi:hypothetical protein
MQRIAPSAALEARIADLLSQGVEDSEQLAELGRLGTRLVLQRAVEDEGSGPLCVLPGVGCPRSPGT